MPSQSESPMTFPNWAYGMVKPNDDREPALGLPRKLAAALLRAHYGL